METSKLLEQIKHFYNTNCFGEAIEHLDKLIEITPNNAYDYLKKEKYLNAIKRYYQANTCLDKAIAIDPYKSIIHLNKGISLSHLKMYDKAIISFDKAI